MLIGNKKFLAKKQCKFPFGLGDVVFGIFMVFNALFGISNDHIFGILDGILCISDGVFGNWEVILCIKFCSK